MFLFEQNINLFPSTFIKNFWVTFLWLGEIWGSFATLPSLKKDFKTSQINLYWSFSLFELWSNLFSVLKAQKHICIESFIMHPRAREMSNVLALYLSRLPALGVSLCTTLESGCIPLPLPPSLLLSTLIWEIFLQIFNIFLLQLFHEENHEILRSWRHQWGPGSDHVGGAEKEDRHQEVGRSQGIIIIMEVLLSSQGILALPRQRHNPIICFQSWPHGYREDTFLSYWFSCFPNA